jgi:PAS domain S-box-containing protein
MATDETASPQHAPDDIFALVTRALNVFYYEWLPATDELRASPALLDLLGYDPKAHTTRRVPELMHPDDIPAYRAAIMAFLKSDRERERMTYRFRSAGGEYRWIEDYKLVQRDAAGWVTRMVGVISDITEAKQREAENQALTAALAARNEAYSEQIEHQAATIDVLKAMSASPGDAQPVFDIIVRQAQQLCRAPSAGLFEFDGEFVHFRSHHAIDAFSTVGAMETYRRQFPMKPIRQSIVCRAILDRSIIHIRNLDAEPGLFQPARDIGHKTVLAVPLMRDGAAVGVVALNSMEVDGISDTQVELLKTFAEQAAIAIRSAETYRALQQRTRDLTESLEQQTATADVLKAISRSAFDLDTVLDTLTRSAANLCMAATGIIYIREGEQFRMGAMFGHSAALTQFRQSTPTSPGRGSPSARAALSHAVEQVLDEQADPEIDPGLKAVTNNRTALAVPLLRDDKLEGIFLLGRTHVEAFSQRQIELVQTFADQALIAIENARLFNEVQARTRELTESLEQQTATAEVLKVISRSAFDLQTVLDTLIASAVRLCNASRGEVFLRGGDSFHIRAHAGIHLPGLLEFLQQNPIKIGRETVTGRVAITGEVHNIADILADEEYEFPGVMEQRALRSRLGVPLVRDGRVEGVLHLSREESQPFTPRQVELVSTFADQAVIALENARLFSAVQERTRELTESLEQQTATAEVLKVISRSAFDLQAVLETLVESAAKLCNALEGIVYLRDGDVLSLRAVTGVSNTLLQFIRDNPHRIGSKSVAGRVLTTGTVVNVGDIARDPDYDYPGILQHGGGTFPSIVGAPLLRDGRVEGVMTLSRPLALPFSPRQVELLATFADQAVIAVENARLFDAVQRRTRELTESLEQQTATAEVLKVISRSAFDLESVLDTLIESAARLCNAQQGFIDLRDGDLFTPRAVTGVSNSFLEFLRENPHRIGGKSAVGRVATTGAVVNIADVEQDPDYAYPGVLDHLSFRSVIGAPLLRDGRVEGVISLTRPQAEPFSPRQVELLATFADQAVIALENARLFGAVQARTGELAQSVAELQALEEVLRAVNSSLDLQTVLSTIIGRAVPLAQADEGTIYEFDAVDEVFVPRAAFGMSDERVVQLRERRIRMGETYLGRSAIERGPIHVADVQQDASTLDAAALHPGIHAVLAIPLLREDKVVGGLVIRRRSEGAFEEATVKLLQTFATQSVLAIANARLFDEVQARTKELTESLEIQSATADVLKAISRSAFDLDVVLDTLTRSAANLCAAATGLIAFREGEQFRVGEMFGHPPAMMEYRPVPGRHSAYARAILSHRVEQILDVQADPEFDPDLKAITTNRTVVAVPLVREGRLEGVFVLGRTRVEAFTQRQIELVQTFADQALIAIENARLFNEVQARTRELTKSLDDLRTAQDRLIQTEKLASLGQLTAGIAHEIKNPLNFVNNFSALSVDLIDELHTALTPVPLDAAVRAEVKEVTDLLRGNLEKVVQHGKRADGIVKNMLLHARESGGERRSVDLNATVDEALNLAYHGARAEKPGFTIALERNLDPAVGSMELYPQEFTRVMLNLISNGFYAATRKARDAAGPDFQPTLTVATEALPDAVVIRVRDNGTGIPDSARGRLFEPFFTTKPAGEGTGLGLSISHDIVVKQHSGSITVDSRLGEYTEFTITLPRTTIGTPP